MKTRFLSFLLVLVLMTTLVLASCGPADDGTPDPTDQPATSKPGDENGTGSEVTDDVPKFEDLEFGDTLPTSYTKADPDWYAYDDLTEKYSLSILSHHYGQPVDSENDAVRAWLEDKFNLDIEFETVAQADMETIISTRFSAGTEPDLFWTYNDSIGKELAQQDLTIDARLIYPYMPQTVQFVTSSMIEWSKFDDSGRLPFITKYGIQDGIWGFAIRTDWLKKFNMQKPKTKEELMAYAKAATFEDPDGNGIDDTYFMTGAGNGMGWGMLGGFNTMVGNPQARVENGQLVHPMFDGSQRKFLELLNEFYEAGVLAPDYFIIEWEQAKAYTLNDKIGMLWYPAGALLAEYIDVHGRDNTDNIYVWEFLEDPPIEGGKWAPSGNPGYTWAFSKRGFSDGGEINFGKLKRVAHMLDTMVMGGENYFHSIQGSTMEVWEAFGVTPETERKMVYNDDGTFYIEDEQPAGYPFKEGPEVGPWQVFGLNVAWQRNAPTGANEFEEALNKYTNAQNDIILGYDRWPNDALLSNVPEGAIAPNLSDYALAQDLAFVEGNRSFDEWDAYQQEWLDMGGRDVIAAMAEKLGVPVPDYAQ